MKFLVETFFSHYFVVFILAKSEAKAAARREAIKEATKRDQKWTCLSIRRCENWTVTVENVNEETSHFWKAEGHRRTLWMF